MAILKISTNCKDLSCSEKIKKSKSGLQNSGCYLRNFYFTAHALIKKIKNLNLLKKYVFISPICSLKTV